MCILFCCFLFIIANAIIIDFGGFSPAVCGNPTRANMNFYEYRKWSSWVLVRSNRYVVWSFVVSCWELLRFAFMSFTCLSHSDANRQQIQCSLFGYLIFDGTSGRRIFNVCVCVCARVEYFRILFCLLWFCDQNFPFSRMQTHTHTSHMCRKHFRFVWNICLSPLITVNCVFIFVSDRKVFSTLRLDTHTHTCTQSPSTHTHKYISFNQQSVS